MASRQIFVNEEAKPLTHTFAEISEGDRCSETLIVSDEMVKAFIKLSGDFAPIHCDEAFARGVNEQGRIVHGLLVSLRFSRLLGMFLPGALSIIHSIKFDYLRPVIVGDEITYSVMVTRLSEAARMAVLDLEARRGEEICVKGIGQCVLLR